MEDEYEDGLVLIAGVLYDAETLEEVSDDDCTHTATFLSEEGYECFNCGRVLGHSWKRKQEEQRQQRRLDAQYIDWVNGEVPSWDVYTVQA